MKTESLSGRKRIVDDHAALCWLKGFEAREAVNKAKKQFGLLKHRMSKNGGVSS